MGTSKTAEEILELFKVHSVEAAVIGMNVIVLPEDEWLHIAEHIASQFLQTEEGITKNKIISIMQKRKSEFDAMIGHKYSSNAVAEGIKIIEEYFPPAYFDTKPTEDVEKLAKHHAMVNYARAEKQSIEDASYIQDVAYYSFIQGYKASIQQHSKSI